MPNASQTEMVEQMRAMRLLLIGARTPDVNEARGYVNERGYDPDVLACPENYPHKTLWIGR